MVADRTRIELHATHGNLMRCMSLLDASSNKVKELEALLSNKTGTSPDTSASTITLFVCVGMTVVAMSFMAVGICYKNKLEIYKNKLEIDNERLRCEIDEKDQILHGVVQKSLDKFELGWSTYLPMAPWEAYLNAQQPTPPLEEEVTDHS